MILTGRHLHRRTFLKGMGATLALPLLDAMTPALATAGTVASPTRLAFTYVPNGVTMPAWTPSGSGVGFELPRILKPLTPFKDDILVLSGLSHHNAYALGDGPGDHARAAACYLTGVHPRKTAGGDIQNAVSVDQVAAAYWADKTRLPSIELGCDDSRTVGNCDSGYSCAYTNSLSWRGPTTPMPPELNPRLVFERLFGAFDTGADPATRERRLRERRSVLDAVMERTRALTSELGASDRRKMDEYLTSVREIERRIDMAEHDTRDLPPGVEKPPGIPVLYADYVKLMFDLQVTAFQTDLTRVSTMMLGREGSLRTYPEIGVPDPHHPLTHHGGKVDWIEKVTQINVFHMELFAHFLERLKATPDGDGTLLDHIVVVYGSGISDGDKHDHDNLPVLLAGRGNGCLTPGRHVSYAAETPMANLYLTLLDRIGVHPESIGDSTGRIEHLDALTA
jgi:hypothetical protein